MGLRLLRKAKNLSHKILKIDRRDKLLKQMPKDSLCIELGVAQGNFSERIIKFTNPKKLYLVDAWNKSVYNDNSGSVNIYTQKNYDFNFLKVKSKFKYRNNVTVIRNTTLEALKEFPDNFFDWIYVDASHKYEDVLLDLEMALTKVKKDGIIWGDDYASAIDKWGDDVINAVNEFALRHKLKLKIYDDQYVFYLLQ